MDDNIAPVRLPQGAYRILLKVGNLAKSRGFCFRITDTDGNPMKDVKCSLTP
jgi:hypothetical protein